MPYIEINDNPGYHLRKINKGVLGELSKIQEELDEAFDAELQTCKIMLEVELSDLLGALKAYTLKTLDLELSDLLLLSENIQWQSDISPYLLKITEGQNGELSKIQESLDKALDSEKSGNLPLLEINLAQILSATLTYCDKQLNRSYFDLLRMQEITERAFKSGRRS